jgi:hypothetical protein
VYGVEMTEAEHVALAEILDGCKGRVSLSGYPSALYNRLYRGWRTVEHDMANHAAGGRRPEWRRRCGSIGAIEKSPQVGGRAQAEETICLGV